jgi:hypothetical protein
MNDNNLTLNNLVEVLNINTINEIDLKKKEELFNNVKYIINISFYFKYI